MPELPEVETIRRQLSRKIIGKRLNGQKVTGVRRRAKILLIGFTDKSSLVIHLKLTGQLIFNGEPSRHTRKVFNFSDGTRLIFNDLRKFGWWKRMKGTKKMEDKFGPEALKVSLKIFEARLEKRPKSKIKSLLMDQKFIAGIGNIYSDEILFASRVRPGRLGESLDKKEIKKIFQNIKKILRLAIKHQGSSVDRYLDACGRAGDFARLHKVYQKKKCPSCGGEIKRVKIGGRTAHFCPNCQK